MTADPTWPLAEEFDRLARTPGVPPDPGLLHALRTWLTGDVVSALLESHAELCAGEARPEAENYAEHLVALADLLDPDDRRAVRAAVDVAAAELYVRTGDDAEAQRRVQRCADDVEELVPELRGDREYVLGCLAERAGNRPDTHAHAARARDLFAGDERWGEAARAAEAAADTHERISPAAVADWRLAAALHVVAGEPDEARGCAEQAVAGLVTAWPGFGPGDETEVAATCTAAASLAREHGLVVAAVRVEGLAAGLLFDSATPFHEVAARLDRCRVELAALDLPPGERRLDDARLDLFRGMACLAHTRWAEAERLLSGVLPVMRAHGTADEVAMLEDALRAAVDAMNGGEPRPEVVTVDAAALLFAGLRLARDGQVEDALAHLDGARDASETANDPHFALFAAGTAAMLRLDGGDRAAAHAAVEDIAAHLADAGGRVPRSARIGLVLVVGTLRAETAGLEGRTDDLLAAYVATEAELAALGARPGAALLAVRRARVLLDAGRPGEALAVGLPAALALDALRCTLPAADRRRGWARQVAGCLDTAVRAAAACGDAHALAELLEVVRGNAVPLPRAPDDRTDAVSALAETLAPDQEGTPTTAVRSGPAAAGGGEERTVLGLPALVRTPWDTVALGAALEAARRYVDPVRADATAEWRVAEP